MEQIHHKLFKSINQNDYQIIPFKTYKRFSFTPSTYESEGIQISYGIHVTGSRYEYLPEPINKDTSYKGAVYDLIHNLYYKRISNNNHTGSYNSLINYQGDVDNFNTLTILNELNDKFIYIGVPQQLFGEKIKPTSFNLQYGTCSIVDDGYNNLIDENNNDYHVGNIFYSNGNIVITDTGSYYSNFNSSSFNVISYNSQFTIYEYNITCKIPKGEFGTTLNLTSFSGSFPLMYNSGSQDIYDTEDFNPYITTIGLYNDDNELLAVAKFPKPIKKYKDMDLNILIKWDA